MNTLIMKFGGSSVGTTTALTQVLGIVLQQQERWQRLLLVVSALEGVTDALIEAAQLAQLSNRRGYRRIAGTLRTRHMALIEHLPLGPQERLSLQADVDRLLFDMLDTCQGLADRRFPDSPERAERIEAIVGFGERLAARIVAALLRQNNLRGVAIDATDLVVTDEVYGNATVNLPLTRERIVTNLLPMLDRRIIPVITGFIGSSAAGRFTTLGRGGSDYTASVIALCTGASELWVWTDVDGIMTSDPREVPEAVAIPALSYDEVAELAYFGARVLHPRMVGPLSDGNIPLRVCNVYKPQQQGTLVTGEKSRQKPALRAVTSIPGLALQTNRSGPLAAIAGQVDTALFTTTGSHVDVMITAQSSNRSFVCFVIPTTAGPDALHPLKQTLNEQQSEGGEWDARTVTVLTAVGTRLDQSAHLAARVIESLDGIPVLALAQGPSHCSLSVVVELKDADDALHRIHALIAGGQ